MAGVSAAMVGVGAGAGVGVGVSVGSVGLGRARTRVSERRVVRKATGLAFRVQANSINNVNAIDNDDHGNGDGDGDGDGKDVYAWSRAAAAAVEAQTLDGNGSNNHNNHAAHFSNWPGTLPEVRGRVALVLPDPSLAASDFALLWTEQDRRDFGEVAEAVGRLAGVEEVVELDNHATLVQDLLDNPPVLAFNCLQEGFRNRESMELHVPALLDALTVPYTGSGADSIVITQNKGLAREALEQVGVPVPLEVYIAPGEGIENAIPRGGIPYPAFAKYGNASNSLGISEANIAADRHAAIAVLKQLREREPQRPLLLQEYLTGREVTVAFIGNESTGNFRMLPPLELDFSALDSSWGPLQLERVKNRPELSFWEQTKEVPAAMSAEEMEELESIMQRIVARCNLKDYARIDFRADSTGRLKVMDVNANCWLGGKFRKMAEWGGLSWDQALDIIARSALARANLDGSFQRREDGKKLAELAAKRRLAMTAIIEEREKREGAKKQAEMIARRRVAVSALFEARKHNKDVTELPISIDESKQPTPQQQQQQQAEEVNQSVPAIVGTTTPTEKKYKDDAELVAARRIATTKIIMEMRQQAAQK